MSVLQQGRRQRAAWQARLRRNRRRRRLLHATLLVLVSAVVLLAFMAAGTDQGDLHSAASATAAPRATSVRHEYVLAPASRRVQVRSKLPVRSGLLFNVRTGRVLWERRAQLVLPIASLTKMMTALVVVAHSRPVQQVLITRAATHFSGSGVGLLPLGKRVAVETLLYGLLLPSGNDAAIALAQHVAGSQRRFIAMMNARARQMGLRCTRFDTVSGIIDAGNHSCAGDLATLAHAVLRQPRLRRIVATRRAVLPFPIKAGKLYLYNNNPLLVMGYRGADGVKTGYTVAAGRCLVATARRGRAWYGVVLLHSADPPGQAQELLDAAFAGVRRLPAPQRSTK
jgi:D-alanyl-D-alanine carboxypeptidase (penicillin-binding protein 5/6)